MSDRQKKVFVHDIFGEGQLHYSRPPCVAMMELSPQPAHKLFFGGRSEAYILD